MHTGESEGPARFWRLPTDAHHRLARCAGDFCFVGGAGDFDDLGRIVHVTDTTRQLAGALENLQEVLNEKGLSSEDIVRIKVYYLDDPSSGHSLLARLLDGLPAAPSPVISMQPVTMAPWPGQQVQLQAIALKGWRWKGEFRAVVADVAMDETVGQGPARLTVGLRAGDFFAATNGPNVPGIGIAPVDETTSLMSRLSETLAGLGANFADVIKKEGYYLGSAMSDWQPMAEERARHFSDPGPVATVVPWHSPWPAGSSTKIEVLGYRASLHGTDKHVPRADSWPATVWDWPVPVPYRQGLRVRDCIWLGGQVPWGAGGGTRLHAPGNLLEQVSFTLDVIDDILAGFDRRLDDLALLVCHFESDGSEEVTRQLVDRLSSRIPGSLPPLTLVPQPAMHYPEMKTEIWGIACG